MARNLKYWWGEDPPYLLLLLWWVAHSEILAGGTGSGEGRQGGRAAPHWQRIGPVAPVLAQLSRSVSHLPRVQWVDCLYLRVCDPNFWDISMSCFACMSMTACLLTDKSCVSSEIFKRHNKWAWQVSMFSTGQCCGSTTFHDFGVDPDPDPDPCLWLMDPGPPIFVTDLQEANKKLIF